MLLQHKAVGSLICYKNNKVNKVKKVIYLYLYFLYVFLRGGWKQVLCSLKGKMDFSIVWKKYVNSNNLR